MFTCLCGALQADYIVLWALPAVAAAAAAGAPGSLGDAGSSGAMSGQTMGAAVEAALLPGIYALYGACSPAEVRCLNLGHMVFPYALSNEMRWSTCGVIDA